MFYIMLFKIAFKMIFKKIRYCLQTTFILMISSTMIYGCGFHLRGYEKNTTAAKSHINSNHLALEIKGQNITRELEEQLKYEINVTHFSNTKLKEVMLEVFDETYQEEIQVLNAQGQIREIKLIKQATFLLKDRATNNIIHRPQTLEVVSDFSVNESLILSKSTEKKRIIESLQKQLAHDILQKSFYILQNY
jgi:outer membrane lipopolysaccharide assembly protein LptE/RlpB